MINALKEISECVTPALFVLFVALSAFWFFSGTWKKCRQTTICLGSIVLIMLVWRLAFQIQSSRYAAGMIFPILAIIFFMTRQLGRGELFRGTSVEKWGIIIITIILSIFFVAKLLRINPHADYLIRASQALNQVIIPYHAPIILASKEVGRLHYYGKLPVYHFNYSEKSENLVGALLREVKYYSGCADAVIFCISIKKEQLSEIKKSGAEIVFQTYTNRQEKKIFAIILFTNLPILNTGQKYHISPIIGNHQIIWTDSFTDGVKNDPKLLHNRMMAEKRLFFFQKPDIIMPETWQPFSYSRKTFIPGSAAEYELVISEFYPPYSLRMKADSCIMLGSKKNLNVQNGCLRTIVKGKPGSRFGLLISEIASNWSYKGVWGEKKFWLEDESLREMTWELSGLPSRFRIGIVLLHGEIIVEKIEMINN